MIEFILNNQHIKTDLPPTTVLLDFIRREKKLTATKEGCREGDCGACTVLCGSLVSTTVQYQSINSCLVPLANVHGKHIVTVEGISAVMLSPIQQFMVDEGGTQCGFCTPGFVISMTGYFLNNRNQNLTAAINALGGNICRCTGYEGIKRSVLKSMDVYSNGSKRKDHFNRLIELNFIPTYFKEIPDRLRKIKSSNKPNSKQQYLVAGGTDLYVQTWESLVQSKSNFAAQEKIPTEIVLNKNQIKIGGAVTIQQFLESQIIGKYFPSLVKQLELFGSLPIRNRATVAGNIVNASPIGDLTNILVALDADLHLRDGNKNRTVYLRDFYKGYKLLDKKKNEVVEWVAMPIPPKHFYFNYEKVSKRTYLDIASVNTTLAFIKTRNRITCIGLSAGGVAPIPLHLERTCEFLSGQEINSANIKAAASIAQKEIAPISDARGSAEYKRLLLRQLIYAHFIKLFPQQINAEELL